MQWYADGLPVSGATGRTFLVGQKEVDKRITARVTASAMGYRKAAETTAATTPVVAGTVSVTGPHTVNGRPTFGETLTIRPGTVAPADATVAFTWMRDGGPIPGATGPTYVVGTDDVGRSLSVRAEFTRPSFRGRTESLEIPGVVTTVPTVRVRPTGRRGRAVVAIRVDA